MGTSTEVRIGAGADDVEQKRSGSMELGSSDIELVDDGPTALGRTIGLRFNGLDVPQGAVIISAYLQFQVDERDTAPANLQVRGADTDNAPAFTKTAFNVSSRPLTDAVVDWTPPAWGCLLYTSDAADE